MDILTTLAPAHRQGTPLGITSVCSAHPVVLRAAIRRGAAHQTPVLIEATCNQVNHLGGYTGMTPAGFATLVGRVAEEEALPPALLILGGDHLGPNPWRKEPAEAAMEQAVAMIRAYAAAGFRKLHLDASMGCADEPEALDDATTASRAARLADAAETSAREAGWPAPFYVIGTEVPPPGGADHLLSQIEPTSPDAARQTIAVHRETFAGAGLSDAFARVIGLVVQPGVEFGNANVIAYDRARAKALTGILSDAPFVFEAHSTDYQGTAPLRALVEDGFAILKVGPELTFVLREALYGLDLIASDLLPDYGARPLKAAMEALMLSDPVEWQRHYPGTAAEQRVLRHYSCSDRIRYYWNRPEALQSVARLTDAMQGQRLPVTLMRQHLPALTRFADVPLDPQALLIAAVDASLNAYHLACHPGQTLSLKETT